MRYASAFGGRRLRTLIAAIPPLTLVIALAPLVLPSSALLPTPASAQELIFSAIPQTMQLIPRDESNTGLLRVAGSVTRAGHETVQLDVYRSGVPWRSIGADLVYQNGVASFDLGVRIPAEMADYDFRFYLDGVPEVSRFRIVSGDVYLINGQSNAQTLGGYSYINEYIRSFGSSVNDPTVLADSVWGIAQAQTTFSHCAVGTWGMELAKILTETYGVPVAILNGAVGGTAIFQHLREDGDPMDPNTIYGRLLWRVTKAGVRSDIKAILWHQGESDANPVWTDYRKRFETLHTDWQEDFAPQKVYVFQIHPGCGGDDQSQIREIERTLPESFHDIDAMSTVGVGLHDGCHYAVDGYRQMGRWISRLVARDFYGEADTLDIRPPNVQRIWYSTTRRDEIRVEFDNAVSWPADTLDISLKDYIYLDGVAGHVLEGHADGADPRVLVVTLDGPSGASVVTYLPNLYDNLGRTYEGPFIRGRRGVGALSFFEFPIMNPADVPGEDGGGGSAGAGDGRESLHISVVPNPFRDHAEIVLTLPREEAVRLDVIDAGGRVVRVLAERAMRAGVNVLPLDPREEWGGGWLASGTFFVRCTTGSGGEARVKAVVLR